MESNAQRSKNNVKQWQLDVLVGILKQVEFWNNSTKTGYQNRVNKKNSS